MKKGFSLIELIIVMAIFVVLASMVTIAFNHNQKHKQLDVFAQSFLLQMREVQSQSLTGYVDAETDDVPDGGYGVYISEDEYVIFADKNDNAQMDVGEDIKNVAVGDDFSFEMFGTNITFLPYQFSNGVCWNAECGAEAVKIVTIAHQKTGEAVLIYIDQQTGKMWSA